MATLYLCDLPTEVDSAALEPVSSLKAEFGEIGEYIGRCVLMESDVLCVSAVFVSCNDIRLYFTFKVDELCAVYAIQR